MCWCSWRLLPFATLLFKGEQQFSLVHSQHGAKYQDMDPRKLTTLDEKEYLTVAT